MRVEVITVTLSEAPGVGKLAGRETAPRESGASYDTASLSVPDARVPAVVLNLRTTTLQKCAAVPRRARI